MHAVVLGHLTICREGWFRDKPGTPTIQEKLHGIQGVSKKFGEWYQKTNKTEDTNKLNLLAFKIIAILHNTLLAMFIKLLETVSKGLIRKRSQNRCHTFLDCRHVCKTCLPKSSWMMVCTMSLLMPNSSNINCKVTCRSCASIYRTHSTCLGFCLSTADPNVAHPRLFPSCRESV